MVEPPAATAPSAPPSSLNAFNPGIAAVLNGFYFAASRDPATARIAGFAPGDDIGLAAARLLARRVRSFVHRQHRSLHAGFLDFSFQNDNTPAVEEAYIRTKDLPYGLTLKGGRFLSGIGYLNERHAHDWPFSDAPLPYRAFLNNQYGDDGVQVRWLAPTDQFLEFGAEVFRGDAYPAAGSHNAAPAPSPPSSTPATTSTTPVPGWRPPICTATPMNRDSNGHLFNGTTDLGILSLVYKWAPGGNPTVQQSHAHQRTVLRPADGRSTTACRLSQDRSGWYVAGRLSVHAAMERRPALCRSSSTAIRAARADGKRLDDLGHALARDDRAARIRHQRVRPLRACNTRTTKRASSRSTTLLLQYTVIYGPHGAHRY